jgi:hypothetical protein
MQKVIEMNREEAREAAKVMMAYADGAEIEWRAKGEWNFVQDGNFSFDWFRKEYRVKPRKKPSINWDHVNDKLNWLVIQKNGDARIYETRPQLDTDGFGNFMGWHSDNGSFSANSHASFDPGNCDWKDSLVERPK